jgi:hypothetical protein
MKKTLLIIIALIALTTACNPVTYDTFCDITGIVVDLDSGDPIQGALVTLSPRGYNTYTGSDGYFEFLDLDVHQYTVSVSKTGYNANRKDITPVAGSVANIKLTLQKKND